MGLSTSYTILVATVMIVQCNKDRGRQPCQRVYHFKILDSIVLYNACTHINIHYVYITTLLPTYKNLLLSSYTLTIYTNKT